MENVKTIGAWVVFIVMAIIIIAMVLNGNDVGCVQQAHCAY